MAAVRRSMERIIESDPTIRTGLQRGIINSRALSRYILENCAVESTPDAVLGIRRRYPLDGIREDANRLGLEDCNISMRGGVAYLTIENAPEHYEKGGRVHKHNEVDERRKFQSHRRLRLSPRDSRPRGSRQFQTEFPPQTDYQPHTRTCRDLSSSSIRNGETGRDCYRDAGILVCPPEDIIIVPEIDAPRTFEALQQLQREEAQSHPKVRGSKKGFPKREKLLDILRLDESIMNPILAA